MDYKFFLNEYKKQENLQRTFTKSNYSENGK